MNLALINVQSLSKCFSTVNLNYLFVDIGMTVELLIFKPQTCVNLQTRALAFWSKHVRRPHQNL